jgi:DNA-binding NarL/FixJ family response regulator
VSKRRDTTTIKSVLIIEDHPLYGDALAETLTRLFAVQRVKLATSILSGLKLIDRNFSPDLILLDLNLPDSAGTSGYLKLKRRLPNAPVVIISAHADNRAIASFLAVGAVGFIPKNTARANLQNALRDIWNGRIYIPPNFRRPETKRSDHDIREQTAQRISSLTPQQARILKYITKGKLNKEIAFEMSIAEATVKAHITAMLGKLGAKSRTHAAMMIKEASLV